MQNNNESDKKLTSKETSHFDGIVRPIKQEDIPHLKPILETWVRWEGNIIEEEVDSNLKEMTLSAQGKGDVRYLTATTADGLVIGVMGFRSPHRKMKPFAITTNPCELVNAYVSKDYQRGKGVGTSLIEKLEQEARKAGFTEVILNSGPRYKYSGWGFYDKVGYERIGVARNYYGRDYDAPVWCKIL